MTDGIGALRCWSAKPMWFGWTRAEWLFYALVVGVAVVMRFAGLGDRAFHHDEAIHAKESYDMINGKQYRYDPAYHGPLLYFGNALLFHLLGSSEVLARVIPAAFGVGAVVAVALFRWELGRAGTVIAMLAIATSTTFVYYSRFIRNDIYVAFFTIVLVAAVVRYIGWPRKRWIYVAWISLGLSLATKENTFIHGFALAVVILTLGGVAMGYKWRRQSSLGGGAQVSNAIQAFSRDIEHVVYGALVFLGIVFVFYTSFFTYLPGFRDAFTRSIEYWTEVHGSERVNQPWFYYAMYLAVYEPFAIVFGAVAMFRTRTARSPLPVVLAVWILVTWIIYSAAGEKAPWLVLHVLWPPILIASWWVGRWFDARRAITPRVCVGILGGGFLFWSLWFAIPINFERGDVPNDFVVYVQSSSDVIEVAEVVNQAAVRSGKGLGLRVVVDEEFAWPIVWYLRDYTNVGYGKAPTLEDVQVADIAILTLADADEFGIQLPEFVGRQMVLRGWFPESAYKSWDATFLSRFLGDPVARETFGRWLLTREVTPVPTGSFDFVMYVRTSLLGAGPMGRFQL